MAQRRYGLKAALTLFVLGLIGLALPATAQDAIRSDFIINNGDARLDVRLVMPAGVSEAKGAVVFAGGSGTSDVREYVPGFQDALLESIFLPREMAVLYVNKRGVAGSSGSWKWGSIERQADDILAAVNYLRSLPNIDPDNVGIAGHSQGGWVVQLAGSLDPAVAFVISFAGPAVTVRESDLKRVELGLICEGKDDEAVAQGVARRDRTTARRASVGRWFPFFELRLMTNLWAFDPADAIRSLSQPTLLAYGGLDNMAEPNQNTERINEIFPQGTPGNITVHVADSTDHMFRITDTLCFDYEASLGSPYSQEFRQTLMNWVDRNVVE